MSVLTPDQIQDIKRLAESAVEGINFVSDIDTHEKYEAALAELRAEIIKLTER